jgi:hypothetical protein
MNEQEIIQLINNDKWMMRVLETVRAINLPDWMIGAGFVRGKVWDHLHGYTEATPLSDIDVIYFDRDELKASTQDNELIEEEYQNKLKSLLDLNWSVTNQARMHLENGDKEYRSSEDAMSYWPETATAVAVKLLSDNTLELIAPYGIDDLVDLKLRISPNFARSKSIFEERVSNKQWLKKWPLVRVVKA